MLSDGLCCVWEWAGKKIPLYKQGWEDYFVGVKYMKSCVLIVSMQDE